MGVVMRTVDCRTVCSEIEEADIGQPSTTPAVQHMKSCAGCRAFYEERLKLRALVADLEAVEAPADFDFRLRARLANESAGSSMSFFRGNVSFGFPSIALAALLVVLGVTFAWRVWLTPTNTTTATIAAPPAATVESSDQGLPSQRALVNDMKTPGDSAGIVQKRRVSRSARNSRKFATQEFSSTPATVVSQEAFAGLQQPAVFRIETSGQPLRVSLDYESGASRTISVPALSFGSQRVAGDRPLPVKSSDKGVW